MGIVASLAAAPIASEIAQDEKRRDIIKQEEEERLRRQRFYHQGDVDLEVIKRLSMQIAATEEILPEPSKFREGHTDVKDVEKVYLTGHYKMKYKTLSSTYYVAPDSARHKLYPLTNGRKVRSAYPNVRLKSNYLNHVYVPNGVKEITVKSSAS